MTEMKKAGIKWLHLFPGETFTNAITKPDRVWLEKRKKGSLRKDEKRRSAIVVDRVLKNKLGTSFCISDPKAFAEFWEIKEIEHVPDILSSYAEFYYFPLPRRFIGALKNTSALTIHIQEKKYSAQQIKKCYPEYAIKSIFQKEKAIEELKNQLNNQVLQWAEKMEEKEKKITELEEILLDIVTTEIEQEQERKRKKGGILRGRF